MAARETGYFIGTQLREGRDLRPLFEIDEVEWRTLSQALTAIRSLEPSFNYGLVESNYLHLRNAHEFATRTIALGRGFAQPDRTKLGGVLMAAVVNWLTAARMYLDHEQTNLKRSSHASAGQDLADFKQATALAYDSLPGYRFCYKFRNYVQHCGAPLARVKLSADSGTSKSPVQLVQFLLDRDALLTEYDAWGRPVSDDLTSMKKEFPLWPLIAEAMTGFRAIDRVRKEAALVQALAASLVLNPILGRLVDYEGIPTLFAITRDSEGSMLSFSAQNLQPATVRELQAVVSGVTPRESLWGAPPTDSGSSLSPESVAQSFTRQNRGVQILSLWLSESGFTDRVRSEIDRIIWEDQDFGPTIMGLVDVSVLLAGMTAMTIGSTPEVLVLGLLDAYPLDPSASQVKDEVAE